MVPERDRVFAGGEVDAREGVADATDLIGGVVHGFPVDRHAPALIVVDGGVEHLTFVDVDRPFDRGVFELRDGHRVLRQLVVGFLVNVIMLFDDEQFHYTLMEPSRFDLTTIAQAQLLIVNESAVMNETLQQALLDAVSDGASLVVFPSMDDPKNNRYLYNKLGLTLMEIDTNATSVEDLALQHTFFNDMILDLPQHPDFPKVKHHVRLKTNGLATSLLTLQNSDPMLMMTSVGKGQAFVMATALDPKWSDLADNALFVPMMVKMAFMGGKMDKK